MNARVHVSVEDNGVGVDYERVKQVAIERGIVTTEIAAQLRRQEITELLFHPNMSTNTEVTDISGRGVGLSAVHSFVQEVGGHISVISPVVNNAGTSFLLDLPISLATVKVLLVESSRFTFALPYSVVVKTLSFNKSQVTHSAHQDMVEVDGALVPLLYLNKLLDITFADMFFLGRKEQDEIHAVLLEVENEHLLIAINRCLGEQELLIKSLPPILRNIRGFSGSALLPDGRTILLLDAHGLLLDALGDILSNTQNNS
jgi:two-component system chemotaxis sensor kinase CheA